MKLTVLAKILNMESDNQANQWPAAMTMKQGTNRANVSALFM